MITLPPLPKQLPLPPLPTISAFRLPPLISRFGGWLPQWPHGAMLSLLLNSAASLGLLPDDTLRELDGKHFRITVCDLGSVADFRYLAGRFEPCLMPADVPDLSFSADTSAYLQMITRQEDPDTLFFNRRLRIEGDTELGLRVKNMLDAIDIGSVSPRR